MLGDSLVVPVLRREFWEELENSLSDSATLKSKEVNMHSTSQFKCLFFKMPKNSFCIFTVYTPIEAEKNHVLQFMPRPLRNDTNQLVASRASSPHLSSGQQSRQVGGLCPPAEVHGGQI